MIKKQSLHAYLFLGPFLLVFLTVIVLPVVFGIILSFFGQRGARMWFVGFDNYRCRVLEKFWHSCFSFVYTNTFDDFLFDRNCNALRTYPFF